MSPRSLFLIPLFALAAPIAADRLLIAGSEGFVMEADTADGVFEYFACQCSGPINALAADAEHLYAADEWGQLLVFDVEDGSMQAVFFPNVGQINALAAAGGALFAGTEEGLVVRINRTTGEVVSSRSAPAGVRALIAHNGFLIAGGADGALYRARVGQGEFEYFTCFCFSTIQDVVLSGGDLIVADGNGLVARVNVHNGLIESAFFVGAMNSMAAFKNVLLLYYGSGPIPMFDANDGTQLPGEFNSPIDVRAILVLDDETVSPPSHTTRRVALPKQG